MKYFFTVLKTLSCDNLFSKFLLWREKDNKETFYDFLNCLYEENAQDDFSAYVADKILYDQNAFSVACAKNEEISPFLAQAFIRDLKEICEAVNTADTKGAFALGNQLKERDYSVKNLKKFYKQYGYGDFVRYRAFTFENGGLRPVKSPSPIRLSDLKNYEDEKKIVAQNIEHFLEGLPYSNMLLYGERGTGKSSTVHAMLNEYYKDGLRLVELSKENMLSLNRLKEILKDVPLKFIVYIDDLSLNAGDERISSLKAALEGCSEGNTENAMIVATSNRRHIIDEKFSQRNDSVHARDSIQEELSLSDRFGISVLFSSTDKEEYLSIVNQLAKDKNLIVPQNELELLAERWAIVKGGRSPRRAKQFVDVAYSLASKELPIDF